LIYFPLMGLFVLVGLAVFFWMQFGPGSGRAFGNRVAAHIGIPKNVFYPLLVNGVKGSSRELLLSLKRSKLGLDEAGVKLGPTLGRGLERLESRFGTQEMYDRVKPTIARLIAKSEEK